MPGISKYTAQLAHTVDELFVKGTPDPSTEEIAVAHFQRQHLGGEIIDGVRKRLPQIGQVLLKIYDHRTALLSATYYARYRTTGPRNPVDAQRCITTNPRVLAAGILRLDKSTHVLLAKAAGTVDRGSSLRQEVG